MTERRGLVVSDGCQLVRLQGISLEAAKEKRRQVVEGKIVLNSLFSRIALSSVPAMLLVGLVGVLVGATGDGDRNGFCDCGRKEEYAGGMEQAKPRQREQDEARCANAMRVNNRRPS